MAVDGYMWFKGYDDKYLKSESQLDVTGSINNQKPNEPLYTTWFKTAAEAGTPDDPNLFEIDTFSFGIEQTLNIGSQSTGAGAGKVTFEAFSITRKIDRSSPTLFKQACSGTPFKEVALGLRKSSGGANSGKIYLVFFFKLVAVKTINWANDETSPTETIEFEYGGLQIHYSQQTPDGTMLPALAGGWNKVLNVRDTDNTKSIV